MTSSDIERNLPGRKDMGILERALHRNAEALYVRALNHLNGVGVPRSDEEAVRLLRKAAFRGSSRAQALLGWMYCRGTCVPQSYGKAAKWCRKAAEKGDAGAQYDLGEMYEKGRGVPQSDEEAKKWYDLVAQQGMGQAEGRLRALEKEIRYQL